MATLLEMCKSLQGQFNELKTNVNSQSTENVRNSTYNLDMTNSINDDQESTETIRNSTYVVDLSNSTSIDQQEVNEGRYENMGQEEPRATPGSRSYSETVQTNPLPRNNTQNTQNKNEQRPTINARQSAPRNSMNGDQNRKTLLIGDSLLSGVNVKGL